MTTTQFGYVQGEATPPLLEDSVGDVLERAAAHWPETDALVSMEQAIRWTYSQLNYRVNCVAAGLLSLGLVLGDRIGIWAPNCAE